MRYFLIPRIEDVHADNCGCAVLSPGWTHPRRNLPSSVLIVGCRGRVLIRCLEETFVIKPGAAAILPAGIFHEGAEELKDRATYFWFHFTLPDAPVLLEEAEAGAILLDPIVAKQRIDEGALLPLCFSVNNPESIFQSFHELLFEQENPSYTCTRLQLMFRNLLISLTDSVLASRRQTGDRGSRSSAAFLIVTYLAEHMTDSNLSIKSAADAIGLNPDYAGRRFRETMGISVGDYILKKRMELAMRHLQESMDTVDRIAVQCGYSSTRHFLRQFRIEKGMTPTEARQRYRTMHVNAL
jgi:AraC-like DNA-binding protein